MASYRQDMPPEGGYAPIHYQRIPHKRVFQNWMLVTGYVALTLYGFSRHLKRKRFVQKRELERYENLVSLEPFLLAERDRSFLKQLHINREYERELMKNNPLWEVGTLFGEKLFKTVPEGNLPPVTLQEYYNHRPHFEQWETTWPDAYL